MISMYFMVLLLFARASPVWGRRCLHVGAEPGVFDMALQRASFRQIRLQGKRICSAGVS